MLDCGFTIRETERRMQRLGISPEELAGILVTHEHQDHVGGVFKFARRHGVKVWLSFGTYQAVQKDCNGVAVNFCRDSEQFSIQDLQFSPFTVPHDAREPVQYVASNGCAKLGVLTDVGQSTSHLIQALSGCDALMLECNHDRRMLANSAYPPSLKQRIGGPYGHLSNDTAAEILDALDKSRLKTVVGAHLSRQNNTPALAREAICRVIQDDGGNVFVACQDEGFGWIELAA